MNENSNEKFGIFLAEIRKEKGLTQKEVAQKLFISDKAVSKWECGLSRPDIALLLPLSNLLGVTVTELLSGQRLEATGEIDVRQVETLVTRTIKLSEEEEGEKYRKKRARRGVLFFACVGAVALEIALLSHFGYTNEQLNTNLLTMELLYLIFGGWFCLFAKERLPAYYDQNKISAYSDGIFRMNVPGVHFNNSNWPHIVRVGRLWTMTVFVGFPLLYFAVSRFPQAVWEKASVFMILGSALSIFIPIYVVGKRYE